MATATQDLSVLARAAPRQPTAPDGALTDFANGVNSPDGAVPEDGRPEVPLPRPRWKTRVLLPAAIFVATAATLAIAAGRALWPATEVRVAPVVVKAGTQSAGKVITQAPGWVEADPFATAVSALADGIVQEVLVLEGEAVEAGQVVARLIDEDAKLALARADAMRNEARAGLAAAEAELKAAQREWDNPVELTRKLATSEAELAEKQAELARWPAELAADEAMAEYKRAEYERTKPLHAQGTASGIEYVRALQEYENARATAEATRGRKPIIEAQIAALEAEVTAARDNLRLRIGETKALEAAKADVVRMQAAIASAEAERATAQLRLERMEVRSPAAGIVMNRLAEPGSKLMMISDDMRSAQVVRLYDPARLQVRVDVPLAEAAKVGVGQEAEVVVEVLPERVFKGHVTRIVNEADVQKNTLQVKVAIHDPSWEIKPEMLARARFFAAADAQPESQAQRLFVPEATVIRHAGGHTMVWLADQARNVAIERTIVPGRPTADGWIEVESGLSPGDRVVANAPASLKDGARIRILGEIAADSRSAGGSAHGAH